MKFTLINQVDENRRAQSIRLETKSRRILLAKIMVKYDLT